MHRSYGKGRFIVLERWHLLIIISTEFTIKHCYIIESPAALDEF